MTTTSFAFVFPGQGSQKTGMLAEMAAASSVVEKTYAEASEALGFDLWNLVQNGDQETLNLTEHTQPVLLTAGVALWRIWRQAGGAAPSAMSGHSLGEFSALVCAGALAFPDAVRLVRDRGRFMQTAVPVGEGAMAAVLGLDDQRIEEICREAAAQGVVEPVNFNAPGQMVIAGHVAAVERAMEMCKEAGAKRAVPLPVSAPFHTSLMRPAGEKLAESLAGLSVSRPEIPVIHNVHARSEQDPEAIKALLVEQIHSPVKWVDCVRAMVDSGVETVVECGPGKVLSGLNKRIHKPLQCLNIEDPATLETALQALSA